MSFIDTLMLGSLTESSIAAASLASQPVFVFTVVHFGLSGGSSVLTAQFWGSKDVESLKKTMGLMYRISAVISKMCIRDRWTTGLRQKRSRNMAYSIVVDLYKRQV